MGKKRTLTAVALVPGLNDSKTTQLLDIAALSDKKRLAIWGA
jgi:hypothetical protein